MVERVRAVWAGILKIPVEEDTDFFGAGAGSMDVVRLIEEVKEEAGVTLTNEEVFMATQFKDFTKTLVVISRGGGGKKAQGKMAHPTIFHDNNCIRVFKFYIDVSVAVYDTVKLHVNKMDVSFPSQLYIDGQFVDATSGRKLRSIDPRDESLICEVECASKEDVDKACKAAHRAHAVSVYKCSSWPF